MSLIDWNKLTITEPPVLPRELLRNFKKGIDGAFRDFSRSYGEALENFFHPLLMFLKWFQDLLVATPWPIILFVIGALVMGWISQLENVSRCHFSISSYWLDGYVGRYNGNLGNCISRYSYYA